MGRLNTSGVCLSSLFWDHFWAWYSPFQMVMLRICSPFYSQWPVSPTPLREIQKAAIGIYRSRFFQDRADWKQLNCLPQVDVRSSKSCTSTDETKSPAAYVPVQLFSASTGKTRETCNPKRNYLEQNLNEVCESFICTFREGCKDPRMRRLLMYSFKS